MRQKAVAEAANNTAFATRFFAETMLKSVTLTMAALV